MPMEATDPCKIGVFGSTPIRSTLYVEGQCVRTRIRFISDSEGETYYVLKLGPMADLNPLEREFAGGDEIVVKLTATIGKPECVDITFDDGQIAFEVSREYFEVIQ